MLCGFSEFFHRIRTVKEMKLKKKMSSSYLAFSLEGYITDHINSPFMVREVMSLPSGFSMWLMI